MKWNLDDTTQFRRYVDVTLDYAVTWADTRPGKRDRDTREALRARVTLQLTSPPPTGVWWAARITVRKAGKRPFDIDNVAKPILDSFSTRQIDADNSRFRTVALYPDDSVDHVCVLLIEGERGEKDSTRIELFASLR